MGLDIGRLDIEEQGYSTPGAQGEQRTEVGKHRQMRIIVNNVVQKRRVEEKRIKGVWKV